MHKKQWWMWLPQMIYLWLACNCFVRDTIKMLTLPKSKRLRSHLMIYFWLACNPLCFVRDTIKMLTLPKSKRLRPHLMIYLWLACNCFVRDTIQMLTLPKSKRLRSHLMINLWLACVCLGFVTNDRDSTKRDYRFEANMPSKTLSIWSQCTDDIFHSYLDFAAFAQMNLVVSSRSYTCPA